MKVLNFSLDEAVLTEGSRVAERLKWYGGVLERYDVIVANGPREVKNLAPNVSVTGVGPGSRLGRLRRMWQIAAAWNKRYGYDVISVQDVYYGGALGILFSRLKGVGCEIQVHGFEKYAGIRKLLARFALGNADAVRVVSERLKRKLVSEFGVAEEKITVVPIYHPVRPGEARGSGADKFVFITVSRLVPVKNVGLQLRALRSVAATHPEAELRIVGDGPEREKLEALAEELGVKTKAEFLGYRSDVLRHLEQADAFVLSSDSEGWGLAVIEAAARGLPVVMTDVGCAGEVFKSEESALVVDPGDEAGLAAAMLRLIEDAGLRDRLAKAGAEAVRRLPSLERTLEGYLESWKKAAGFTGR